eukprot:gene2989-3259_t
MWETLSPPNRCGSEWSHELSLSLKYTMDSMDSIVLMTINREESWQFFMFRLMKRSVRTLTNPTRLPDDWTIQRNVYPHQGSLPLDFNYWISHSRMEADLLSEIITSLLSGKKSAALASARKVNHLYLIAVSGLDHSELKAHLAQQEEQPAGGSRRHFLCTASSMPSLLVQRSNPYNEEWFYNDVKPLNSFLLWPLIPRGKADLHSHSLVDLLHRFLVTVRKDSGGRLTLIPDKTVWTEIDCIIETTMEALKESHTSMEPRFSSLSNVEKGDKKVCGWYISHDIAENGFFSVIPSTDQVVLIWDRGDVSLFEREEIVDRVENMIPLNMLHPVPSLSIAKSETNGKSVRVVGNNGNGVVGASVKDDTSQSKLIDGVDQKVDLEELIKSTTETILHDVMQRYQTIPFYRLEELVLSRQLMQLMGYMIDGEHTRCWVTSRKGWFHDQQTQQHSAANKIELEDGEELDEEDNGDILAAIHTKLCQQAFVHFFSRLSELSLPLKIAALDCEMCSTKNGLELTRITVVHPVYGVLLDTLVKPDREIIDYHTEFSGVTEEALDKISTTLRDVQEMLRLIISKETILVGHSLDADLKILQIVHDHVIDVAALYPHHNGLPYKYALKKLSKDILGREIQDSENGHDSAQDALAALELALVKANELMVISSSNGDVSGSNNHDNAKEHQQLSWQLGERDYQQPRYPLHEHCWQSCKEHSSCLQFEVHSCCLPAPLPLWEADGFGYRADSQAKFALENPSMDHKSRSSSLSCSNCSYHSWEEMMKTVKLKNEEVKNSEPGLEQLQRVVWCDLQLYNRTPSSLLESGVDEPYVKRRKLAADGGSLSILELDRSLDELYASLPPDSAMVVLTQDSLIPLRHLVAKKIRNKWAMAKRDQKISLPMMKGQEQVKLSSEWNAIEDEADLLKAAERAANGCVFISFKPQSSLPLEHQPEQTSPP